MSTWIEGLGLDRHDIEKERETMSQLPHTDRIAQLIEEGKTEEALQLQAGFESAWFKGAQEGKVLNLTDLLASCEQLHIAEFQKPEGRKP